MSIRPHEKGSPPSPPAILEWPGAPGNFSDTERGWWARIGEAVMGLGAVSEADLPVAARAAQISTRVDAAMLDAEFKPTALNALLRLELDYWKQLGLSPQARRGVTPLPKGEGESGYEDVE